ncbi:unnamed protein product [Peronospora destructor]|uniref:Trafficking protein particle complex subunit 11 C-terminal domain-containing protein n=1 Tax=Peronospora destructor TaxID=86335 RepID=A0AAV0U024_9STRA|nr:unnamed protein product [Peronospora destructor]
MKVWSEEWRCARLRLHLRNDELFQGETVHMQVFADVMLSSSGSKAPTNKIEGLETATQLLQRWQEHCKGARVHIEVMEVPETDFHATSFTPSSATLFRQETQFFHVSVDHLEGEAEAAVVLKAHFDLNIGHEFWDRPVLLIVHMTPKIGVARVAQGANDPEPLRFGPREPVEAFLLRDECVSALLSLTREEAQSTPLMTRRVEQRIVITKPLQLEIKIRELAGRRVGVLARVLNAHSTLGLAVKDLHLYLDQSLQPQNALSSEVRRFRIVSGDRASFPVVLQPQERYNFIFVLEPVEVMVFEETLGAPDDDKQATTMTMTTTLQKKVESSHRRTATTQQHALLTLSWQASTVSMDTTMETHTIVWSPKAPSYSFSSLLSGEHEALTDLQKMVMFAVGGRFKQAYRLGDAAEVCATVTNRSAHSSFDLTLVLPTQSEDGIGSNNGVAPAVVGFESSDRLGLVRPGMSVRQSLHVVFLRVGKCRLGPLVLVDHLTRTCFVSDDWEVFVKT